MSAAKPPICCRCGGPKGYSARSKGLCRSCFGTCPVCEERPRARGAKKRAPYCNPCACALQTAVLCTPAGALKHSQRVRQRRITTPAVEMLRTARARAKRLSLPFNLELNDLIIPAFCPVLGFRLEIGTRRSHESAPSLDRVAPALGYVKGNVRVISSRANSIKNNATESELCRVLEYVKGNL